MDTARWAQHISVSTRDRPGDWQLAGTYRGVLAARSRIPRDKMQQTKLGAAAAQERRQVAPVGWSHHHSEAQNGWQEMTVTFSGML